MVVEQRKNIVYNDTCVAWMKDAEDQPLVSATSKSSHERQIGTWICFRDSFKDIT